MDSHLLPPKVIQIVGLLLLLAFAAFWAVTGRESTLLVGASGMLILLGGYERARASMMGLIPKTTDSGKPGDRE